jgi:hypothetical protein
MPATRSRDRGEPVDPALTAAIITVAAFAVRRALVIGRACLRAAVALVRQLPAGTRVVVRFGRVELTLLIARPHALTDRSEPDT